ncbi:MAG: hypothetical protein AMXMBFR7_30780 [Planctomycetota bacterium]
MTHEELIKAAVAGGEKAFADALKNKALNQSERVASPCKSREHLVLALGVAIASFQTILRSKHCTDCMYTHTVLNLAREEIFRILDAGRVPIDPASQMAEGVFLKDSSYVVGADQSTYRKEGVASRRS